MTQESEQDTIYDSSSSSTIVEQSDYHEEITKWRAEFIALISFVIRQFHFIEEGVRELFEVEKNSQEGNYISRLLEDINYLKQESKTKSLIMQSLIQSGNTNNYYNDNGYSKSNNDENNNSGIGNDHIHIPNDDRNITTRRRKNKSSKDKSTYINNKDKNSNKINSKNDNKNNIRDKYNKSSESSRSCSNDTIDTSTYNQKEKVFILGDSMVKNVNGFLLTRNLNHKCLVKIWSFPGPKVRCLHDYAKSIMRNFNPNQIILHVGTNDLNSEKTSSQIANSIIDLRNSLKTDNIDITTSLIAPRADNLNNKANEVNNRLVNMCNQRNIRFTNHSDDIQLERHVNDSKVCLNWYGTMIFVKNFTKFLSDLYWWGNDDSSIRGKLKSDFEINFTTKNQIHQIKVSDSISMSLNENEVSVSSTKQTYINRDLELPEKNNLEPINELRQIH